MYITSYILNMVKEILGDITFQVVKSKVRYGSTKVPNENEPTLFDVNKNMLQSDINRSSLWVTKKTKMCPWISFCGIGHSNSITLEFYLVDEVFEDLFCLGFSVDIDVL